MMNWCIGLAKRWQIFFCARGQEDASIFDLIDDHDPALVRRDFDEDHANQNRGLLEQHDDQLAGRAAS
jgi:hypothetical protein